MASGMTKTQLTRHLAEKLGSNNKTAANFLEHLADVAIKETKKNGVFVVPGLGRLVKAHRKARMGRNPQTGEPIQIKAKTVVKFRVAKAAKDAIARRSSVCGADTPVREKLDARKGRLKSRPFSCALDFSVKSYSSRQLCLHVSCLDRQPPHAHRQVEPARACASRIEI